MHNKPLKAFLLRTLLWFPIAFFVWFYFASLLTLPLAAMVRPIILGLFPEWIEAIEQQSYLLDVVTRFAPPASIIVPPGQEPIVILTINPLIYGYSLPFFAALTLAAPSEGMDKSIKILLGVVLLLPVQTWGVVFDIIKTLSFDLGATVATKLGIQGWRLEAVALGYQFGYLILPAISPLIIWIAMHRRFVANLVPWKMGEEDVVNGHAP